jgi:hypothetical protein
MGVAKVAVVAACAGFIVYFGVPMVETRSRTLCPRCSNVVLLAAARHAVRLPSTANGWRWEHTQTFDPYTRLLEMAVTGSLIEEAGSCNGGPGGCAIGNVARTRLNEENGEVIGHPLASPWSDICVLRMSSKQSNPWCLGT